MNELIFFLHIFAVIFFVLIAFRLGEKGLYALLVLQGVLANLFVVKQMDLFGLTVTCSDVFAIGGILSLNLIQEYFGKESAQKAIAISLVSLIFYAFMSQIHLLYIPSFFDTTHEAFLQTFSSSGRLIFASIATFYLVQKFDVLLFGKLRGMFLKKVFISAITSQVLDTILFSFLGLYGMVESLFHIILVSILVKWTIISICSPFTVFAKRFATDDI